MHTDECFNPQITDNNIIIFASDKVGKESYITS